MEVFVLLGNNFLLVMRESEEYAGDKGRRHFYSDLLNQKGPSPSFSSTRALESIGIDLAADRIVDKNNP